MSMLTERLCYLSPINPVTPNYHLDKQGMSQTFPGDKFVPKYTPSLAITRAGLKHQKRIHHMSNDSNYHQPVKYAGIDTESEQTSVNLTDTFKMQKPVPPIRSPRMDTTNRTPQSRRWVQVNTRELCSVVNPRSKHDVRTGFWKTVTRPTPGELILKHHKVREEERFRSDNNHQNIEDPDVLSTNYVLSLLEGRFDEERPEILPCTNFLDDSYLHDNPHVQKDSKNNDLLNRRKSLGTLYDHKQRLRAIRSNDSYDDKTETDVVDLNPKEDQQTAFHRFALRLNSPTFIHKHNQTFCGECIPDMASSRLLVALDSYQRTNSRERTNQSILSKVEAAHVTTTPNGISKFNIPVEGNLQPEILVKFEDGPDSLSTIRLPNSLPLPRFKHRKPEALLKLSLRQSKRSATETALFADQEGEKDDDSYPGFFTFSTTVRPVRAPANTPVPSEIDNYNKSHCNSLPQQNKSQVVNVATHGKGALIIQHHKHLNAAKLDVFLPRVKMGKK